MTKYLLGVTWILAAFGDVAMVLVVLDFRESNKAYTVDDLGADLFLVLWASMGYLAWSLLAWAARKRRALSVTCFLCGLAVCGGGLWPIHMANGDWLLALLVPGTQVVCLGATVGFPFALVLLHEMENPK
jgi:hypothetical protein